MTNRPLNEELQERLLKHLPKGYADDVVPTIKANSAANAMMRYALRQRVESTDPALQQRAYILLNHVAKSYAGGREMVANHAIKRAWDDAVAHDIVLACNIRRSITWDEIPEYLQTEDPVYVILSDIGDPAIREEAIQALFSMPRGSYTQHANRTEAESYAAFAQVTNTVWLHLQEHCHLASLPHFEKDEQSIVFLRHSPKLSKDQMRVVIDTCLEQNTDASYLTMLYYATKMKNYTKDRLLVNELSVRIDGNWYTTKDNRSSPGVSLCYKSYVRVC